MYKIEIKTHFSSAHYLRGYQGKCESLHGHNWKIVVSVKALKVPTSGMVIDFGDLKKITNEVLSKLDHKNLNDIDYFKENNPSSENIAYYIFNQLKEKINNKDRQLAQVKVWETDNSCASYSE